MQTWIRELWVLLFWRGINLRYYPWKVRRPSISAANHWNARKRCDKGEGAQCETHGSIGDQFVEQIQREMWVIRVTMVRSAPRPTQVWWRSFTFLSYLLRSLADLTWYLTALKKPTGASLIHSSKQWTYLPFHMNNAIILPPIPISISHTNNNIRLGSRSVEFMRDWTHIGLCNWNIKVFYRRGKLARDMQRLKKERKTDERVEKADAAKRTILCTKK